MVLSLSCIGFVTSYRVSIPINIITNVVSTIGIFYMIDDKNDGYLDAIRGKYSQVFSVVLNDVCGLIFIQYMLNHGKFEILKAWNTRDATQ